MGWSVDRDDPDGFNEIPRVFAFRFDERFRGFHDREAKKAFSFAATSRMAVLVYPGEILVVGQNLAAIVEQYSLVSKRGGFLLPTLQVKQIFCLSTGNMKV